MFVVLASHFALREYVLFQARRRWRGLMRADTTPSYEDSAATLSYKEQRSTWRYRLRYSVFG